jgi:hypothetical protein
MTDQVKIAAIVPDSDAVSDQKYSTVQRRGGVLRPVSNHGGALSHTDEEKFHIVRFENIMGAPVWDRRRTHTLLCLLLAPLH